MRRRRRGTLRLTPPYTPLHPDRRRGTLRPAAHTHTHTHTHTLTHTHTHTHTHADGEARFVPLHRLLCAVGGLRPADLLVDLGSGTGRVVLGAALAFPALGAARDYELLPGLHAAALATHARILGLGAPCAPVVLEQGDFLEADWSDASLLFATSLCFPPELTHAVEVRARRLAPGARIVLMTATFGDAAGSEGCFRPREVRADEPRHALEVEMDFGSVLFYVYERTEAGASSAVK